MPQLTPSTAVVYRVCTTDEHTSSVLASDAAAHEQTSCMDMNRECRHHSYFESIGVTRTTGVSQQVGEASPVVARATALFLEDM